MTVEAPDSKAGQSVILHQGRSTSPCLCECPSRTQTQADWQLTLEPHPNCCLDQNTHESVNRLVYRSEAKPELSLSRRKMTWKLVLWTALETSTGTHWKKRNTTFMFHEKANQPYWVNFFLTRVQILLLSLKIKNQKELSSTDKGNPTSPD